MVGVAKSKALSSTLNIYPNPVQNTATLKISLEKPASVSVTVFDLLGRVKLRVPNANYSKSMVKIPLDLSKLVDGIYFATISAGKHTVTRQIVKGKL